jgi:hypothetical protein
MQRMAVTEENVAIKPIETPYTIEMEDMLFNYNLNLIRKRPKINQL